MNSIKTVIAAAIALAAPVAAVAQDKGERTVDQYTCKDVIREAGSSRDTAVAFLHGYLLGKSGEAKFNLETLSKQTDAFIDQCLDNPSSKAADVMTKIKG